MQRARLRVRGVHDQVNPVIAVDRHGKHSGRGEPRLGCPLLGAPHGQRREVGELSGGSERTRSGFLKEYRHESDKEADRRGNQNHARLRGGDLVYRGIRVRQNEAGAGVVGNELGALLGELADLGAQLGGTRVRGGLAVLVDERR